MRCYSSDVETRTSIESALGQKRTVTLEILRFTPNVRFVGELTISALEDVCGSISICRRGSAFVRSREPHRGAYQGALVVDPSA